jgi:hypothetical protein
MLKGLCETHPDLKPYGIGSYLSQQLLDTGVLGWIDSKAYTTDEIAGKWYDQLQAGVDTLDRHYTPEQMAEMFESPKKGKVWGKVEKIFTPAIYEYLSDDSRFDAVPEVAADASQALHRALVDNSVTTGWEPQHRIQFFHSKGDVIVPYGNYLAFRDAHPQGENIMYRLNDTFSESDHVDAGASFLITLLVARSYGSYFNWLCEDIPTGIKSVDNGQWIMDNGGWFTLDGRKFNGKPNAKGVFIHRGRKVVIK